MCPPGEASHGITCQPIILDPLPTPNICPVAGNEGGGSDGNPVFGGNPSVVSGNPIEIDSGEKVEYVIDYSIPGARPFEIARTYRSRLTNIDKAGLGVGWSFDHEGHLWKAIGDWSVINVFVERGGLLRLKRSTPQSFDHYASEHQLDEAIQYYPGDEPYWILTRGDGRIMRFDEVTFDRKKIHRLSRIEWPDGYVRTYDYAGFGLKITRIVDSLGRYLTFTYDDEVVAKIETSDGVTLDYSYAYITANGNELRGSGLLTTVVKTMPNGAVFQTSYHYDDPDWRFGLTGVTDARGVHYATYDYDSNGRAILSEHDGGAGRVTVAYDDVNNKRTVANALGRQTVYEFELINRRNRLVSVDGVATANCAASNSTYVNNASGVMISRTDAEGNVTTFAHNERGLETQRIEGAGSSEARIVETEWRSAFSRPTKITTPELETTYDYSASGLLLSVTEEDRTANGVPYSTTGQQRIWTYGYTQLQPAPPVAMIGNLEVLNPQFEFRGLPYWTPIVGGIGTRRLDGRRFLNGEYRGEDFKAQQIVPIPREIQDAVDAGYVEFVFSWMQWNWREKLSTGAASIDFLDAGGATVGTRLISSYEIYDSWTTLSMTMTPPAGTRQVVITLHCDFGAGAYTCDAAFDDVSITYGPQPGPLPLARPALLSSIDGPLPGPLDTVNYEYDAAGNLSAVVNELGHRTEITAVNAVGQPTSILDPNGTPITIAYDDQRRVSEIAVNAGALDEAKTTVTYDAIGQITRIDEPHQTYSIFSYNNARRLASIENAAGERRVFAYNALGDVTSVADYDASGVRTLNLTFDYDELGRLMNFIGAGGQTAHFDYDRNNNRIAATDPRSNVFSYGYDALNRLISETDPDFGVTNIALRSDGAATEVEDAENIATTYVRNGWGEVIREDSPNRGVTDYVYDERGLLTRMTDARGEVTTYAYDAAGRILSETHTARPLETRTYTYDSTTPAANKGVGRLASITDEAGSVSFEYDAHGRATRETRVIDAPSGAQSYVLEYAYHPDDRITRITYPSGREVDYAYAAHGPVSEIKTRAGALGTFTTLASQMTHDPAIGEQSRSTGLGGEYGLWSLRSATLGNGLKMTAGRDLDGRLTGLRVAPSGSGGGGGTAVQDLAFAYDPNSNISSITDGVDPARSQTFRYDALNRLTRAVGLYGTIDYAYDLVGNRTALTRTSGAGAPALQTASYSFTNGTHRLSNATSGGAARTLSYLASGQLSSDAASGAPVRTFIYDGEGRMVEARTGGALAASFAYDASGRRVLKAPASGTAVHYVYGPEGRLLAEHDAATGAPLREYVWSGLMPVAFIDHSGGSPATYYVHTDQVFRPQKLTDASGAVVWDRVETPFGVEVSTTGGLTQPVRFPGQVEDLETALFQNWNRDYDPLLGRYIQSDPIGLLGGINTYAYVEGNPLTRYDPTGEVFVFAIPFSPQIAAGVGLAVGGGLAMFGDDIAAGLIDSASSINDGLNSPSQTTPFDVPYAGPVALCRNTTDEGASNPPLQACLRAAEGGPEDWGNFCGGLPNILGLATAGRFKARDACFSQSYESRQSKINWCQNQFGN